MTSMAPVIPHVDSSSIVSVSVLIVELKSMKIYLLTDTMASPLVNLD